MVNEVESILNEIRERVRADHEPGGVVAIAVQNESNGSEPRANPDDGLVNSESLSRLSAHLTTTARAWDRLPPMYSNRKGAASRLELWIKARLKSMSRWFTWEQVNFNSAVHHSLTETLHTLSALQRETAANRSAFQKEAEAGRAQIARNDQELAALRANIEALTAEIRKHHEDLDKRATAIETRTELGAGISKEIDAARTTMVAQLAGLAGELRESDQQLREEQRVCFKQLSLEASEAAVTADRGRRAIESRLDKLETAGSKGEK